MEDQSTLIWGTLFGGIGIGFFIYGKKQKNKVSLFTGISLFLVPYFASDVLVLVVVSIVLMALPFVVKL